MKRNINSQKDPEDIYNSHLATPLSSKDKEEKELNLKELKSINDDINAQVFKASRLLFLSVIFGLCFLFFMLAVFSKIISKTPPSNVITKTDVSVRGEIYSKDSYLLASSNKLYKVSFNPKSISKDKKELFINLLITYSGISKAEILKAFKRNTYSTIAYNIMPNIAASLRLLNANFLKYDVFQEYEDANGKIIQKMGLDIEVSGVSRNYIFNNILEPVIGYVRKINSGRITRIEGVKGIEKYRDGILSSKRDGKVTGKKDIGSNIILNKNTQILEREDGFDIRLTIPLLLQAKIENLLKLSNKKYKAKELIAGVIDPRTGEILALATSNTFNPNKIFKKDYPSLNVSATELSYEPGSTIKPLVYAYLLQHNIVKGNEIIDTNNGVYKLRNYVIRDDSHQLKQASADEVIIKSSNIGMVKLTKDLSGAQMLDMFKTFKLDSITGIDLPYEKNGILPKVSFLNREVTKASVSYGYGLRTTFIQLLRGYASFVNGGVLISPHITKELIAPNKDIYRPKLEEPKIILSPKVATHMKELLHKVVKQGTGRRADVKGLIIGGKTGTARIAQKGRYEDLYNGSFFGYASDGERSYVIGVVAFSSHSSEDYYGGQTAAPIFSQIAEILVEQDLLKLQNK